MKSLPVRDRLYLYLVILGGFGSLGYTILSQPQFFTLKAIIMTAVLAILGSLALIFNVYGSTERTHYNVSFVIYSFSLFLLGIPGAGIVILISHLIEWPFGKYPWYVQIFNIGQYLISVQLAGMFYFAFNGSTLLDLTTIDPSVLFSVIVALMIFTLVNHFLVGVVIWMIQGESFSQSGIFNFFPLILDFTMLSMGALGAIVWRENPALSLMVAIPLYLLYSTLKVPALERAQEIDPKTGLYNASYFASALSSELARANRYDRPITVVMADLDLLRNINNTYGHLAGDQVLIEVARILKENVREYDVLARFGGEEFSILMPETAQEDAYKRIDDIRAKLAAHDFMVDSSESPIKVTISFGITNRTSKDQQILDLIHQADIALYVAKLSGRNKCVVYGTPVFETMIDGLDLKNEIPSLKRLDDRLGTIATLPPSAPRQKQGPTKNIKTKTETATQAPSPAQTSRQVTLFITLLTLLSVVLLLATWLFSPQVQWADLLAFCAMVFLIELFSIDIYVRETSVSTSAAPLLAGFILFGPVGVALLGASFALAAWLKHRGPYNRIFFNASNQIIPGIIIAMAVRFLFPQIGSSWQYLYLLVLFGVGALILFLLTTFTISAGVTLDRKMSLSGFWRQQFSWLWLYFLGMGLIAFGIYVTFLAMGVLGALIFLIPLSILRLGQVQYINQTKIINTELKNKNKDLRESTDKIKQLNDELMLALAEITELNNPYLSGHSKRVAILSVAIAESIGLRQDQIELIYNSSLLHDIGKFGIDQKLLNTTEDLTPAELDHIRAHVENGVEILSKIRTLSSLIPVIHAHHERMDGRGYPLGLASEDIPIEARIITLADAVDAMNSDRPYRQRLSREGLITEIKQHTGTQFDPEIAKAFLKLMAESNGDILARP